MGKAPSLRQIAGELEISPAYLSYMVNGKRPWRKDLYQRYIGVVNTFVNTGGLDVNNFTHVPLTEETFEANSVVEVRGIEPLAPCMQSRCSPAELHPHDWATSKF